MTEPNEQEAEHIDIARQVGRMGKKAKVPRQFAEHIRWISKAKTMPSALQHYRRAQQVTGGGIGDWLTHHATRIAGVVTKHVGKAVDVAKKVASKASDALSKAQKTASGILEKADKIHKTVSGAIDTLNSMPLPDSVKGVVGKAGEALAKAHGAVSGVVNKANAIHKTATGYVDRANESLNGPSSTDYSSSMKALLSEVGTENVLQIQLGRAAIGGMMEKVLSYMSLGSWDAKKGSLVFDSIFHAFLIINLNNTEYLLENTGVITMRLYTGSEAARKGFALRPVALLRPFTFQNFLDTAKNALGPEEFFIYDKLDGGSQRFVDGVMHANAAIGNVNYSAADSAFINENLDALTQSLAYSKQMMPAAHAAASKAMDLHRRANWAVYGKGFNARHTARLHHYANHDDPETLNRLPRGSLHAFRHILSRFPGVSADADPKIRYMAGSRNPSTFRKRVHEVNTVHGGVRNNSGHTYRVGELLNGLYNDGDTTKFADYKGLANDQNARGLSSNIPLSAMTVLDSENFDDHGAPLHKYWTDAGEPVDGAFPHPSDVTTMTDAINGGGFFSTNWNEALAEASAQETRDKAWKKAHPGFTKAQWNAYQASSGGGFEVDADAAYEPPTSPTKRMRKYEDNQDKERKSTGKGGGFEVDADSAYRRRRMADHLVGQPDSTRMVNYNHAIAPPPDDFQPPPAIDYTANPFYASIKYQHNGKYAGSHLPDYSRGPPGIGGAFPEGPDTPMPTAPDNPDVVTGTVESIVKDKGGALPVSAPPVLVASNPAIPPATQGYMGRARNERGGAMSDHPITFASGADTPASIAVHPNVARLAQMGGTWVPLDSVTSIQYPSLADAAAIPSELKTGVSAVPAQGLDGVVDEGAIAGGSWFSDAWGSVKHAASSAVSGIKNAASSAWHGVTSAAKSVGHAVKDVAGTAWSGVKDLGKDAVQGAKDVVSGVKDVGQVGEALINKAKGIAKDVMDKIPGPIKDILSNVVLPAAFPEAYLADEAYSAATGDDPMADVMGQNETAPPEEEEAPPSPPPMSPGPQPGSPEPTSPEPVVRPPQSITANAVQGALSQYRQRMQPPLAQSYVPKPIVYPTPQFQRLYDPYARNPDPYPYAPPPPPLPPTPWYRQQMPRPMFRRDMYEPDTGYGEEEW